MIIKYVKKGLLSGVHLVGVMLTLIGANVISNYWVVVPDQTQIRPKAIPQTILNTKPPMIYKQESSNNKIDNFYQSVTKHADICQIDFGCAKNSCWRSCHSNNDQQNLWCHTAPTPNARKFYRCEEPSDCFICWECIESCHP